MGGGETYCVCYPKLELTTELLTVSSSSIQKDNTGADHLIMHFNVEGPLNKGVVSLHMTKHPAEDAEFEYRYLKLDVKGHPTVYLEGGTANSLGKGQTKLFGVRWR
jgi:import inner membrane translocase subunit TIM21